MATCNRQRNFQIFLLSLFVIFPLILFGMFKAFTQIDCYTAEQNLAFMDRCIESDNCTLTARELQKVEAYERLRLARCPKN